MSTDRQASKYDERTFHEDIVKEYTRLNELPKEFDGEGYTRIKKLHETLTKIYFDDKEKLTVDAYKEVMKSQPTYVIMQYDRFLEASYKYNFNSIAQVSLDKLEGLHNLQQSINSSEVNKDDYPLACAHASIEDCFSKFSYMNQNVLKYRMFEYFKNYKVPPVSWSKDFNIGFFTRYVDQFTNDLLESGYNIKDGGVLIASLANGMRDNIYGGIDNMNLGIIIKDTDFGKTFFNDNTRVFFENFKLYLTYNGFIQECYKKRSIASITNNLGGGKEGERCVEIEGKKYTKLSQELIKAAKKYSENPMSLYLRLIDDDSTRNPYMGLDMAKECELQYCEIDFKAIKEKLLDNNIKIKEEEVEGLSFDENKKTYTYIDPKIKEEIDFCKSNIYLPVFLKAFGNGLPEYKGETHDERVVKGQVNTEDSVSSNEKVHKNILQKFLGLFVDLYNMVVGWLSKIVAFFKGEKVQQGVSSTVVFSLESSTMQSPEGDVSKN